MNWTDRHTDRRDPMHYHTTFAGGNNVKRPRTKHAFRAERDITKNENVPALD